MDREVYYCIHIQKTLRNQKKTTEGIKWNAIKKYETYEINKETLFRSKQMLYKTKTIFSNHYLVESSEIKKNGCDVLMIKGNTVTGLNPGVAYLDEI